MWLSSDNALAMLLDSEIVFESHCNLSHSYGRPKYFGRAGFLITLIEILLVTITAKSVENSGSQISDFGLRLHFQNSTIHLLLCVCLVRNQTQPTIELIIMSDRSVWINILLATIDAMESLCQRTKMILTASTSSALQQKSMTEDNEMQCKRVRAETPVLFTIGHQLPNFQQPPPTGTYLSSWPTVGNGPVTRQPLPNGCMMSPMGNLLRMNVMEPPPTVLPNGLPRVQQISLPTQQQTQPANTSNLNVLNGHLSEASEDEEHQE